MGIYGALQQVKGKEFGAIEIQTEKFRPLPVFKQIMTMFCDINQGCMGDDSLRKFLLHKETTDFKKTTPNAIQKSKPFNLAEMFGYDKMPDIDVIAKALDGRMWEEF